MTGTLAQLIALVAYGNVYLTTSNTQTDFYPRNSVFQFCHGLQFIEVHTSGKEDLIGITPKEWFAYLKQQGIKKLELHYQSSTTSQTPDHQLAGFIGGGGDWLIKLISNTSSTYNYWYGRWAATHQNDPDRKIWSIDYKHVYTGNLPIYTDETVEMASIILAEVLTDISAFATAIKYENFASIFKNALAVLISPKPEQGYYHQDLLPVNYYNLRARQLIIACSNAWVFGGMGSWNDIYVVSEEDNKRYDELSAALYKAINRGVLVATNSF